MKLTIQNTAGTNLQPVVLINNKPVPIKSYRRHMTREGWDIEVDFGAGPLERFMTMTVKGVPRSRARDERRVRRFIRSWSRNRQPENQPPRWGIPS